MLINHFRLGSGKDRVVKTVDGSTLTMPDWVENQKEYPKASRINELRLNLVPCGLGTFSSRLGLGRIACPGALLVFLAAFAATCARVGSRFR